MRSTSRDQSGTVSIFADSLNGNNSGIQAPSGIPVRMISPASGEYHMWFDSRYVPVAYIVNPDRAGSAICTVQEPGHLKFLTYNAAGTQAAAYVRIHAICRVAGP